MVSEGETIDEVHVLKLFIANNRFSGAIGALLVSVNVVFGLVFR
jgi:hypothetical protein